MTARRRLVIIRWPLGWAALGTTLLLAAATLVLVQIQADDTATRWTVSLGVLALTASATGWLFQKLIWFPPLSPIENAVAQLLLGHDVVGSAVRVRRRLLITSAGAVSRALDRRAGDGALVAPHPREQVRLRFPTGPDSDRAVWARVALWGPARPGLRCHDVAILRTVDRLPWWIPRVPVAPSIYKGLARVVLAPSEAVAESAVDHPMEVRDHELVGSLETGARAGTPLVAAATNAGNANAGQEMVALLAARTAAAEDERPAVSPLVEADDLRAVLRDVSRRQLLRTGAGAIGLAALGGSAALLLSSRRTRLVGAGWKSLFDDDEVRRFLNKQDIVIADMRDVSGVRSLEMSPELLGSLGFITCPNQAVAAEMRLIIDRQRGSKGACQPYTICASEMVIVTHRERVAGLARANLLTYPKGVGPAGSPRFDVRRYLTDFGTRWGAVDPHFGAAADEIRISYSDPLQTGGGEMFLMLLAQVRAELARTLPGSFHDEPWLWESDGGPLWGQGESRTAALTRNLARGQANMIFTYEHDAAAFLAAHRDQTLRDDYVLLRTSPQARFNQYCLGITSDGRRLGELFELNRTLADILSRRLHLRTGGSGQQEGSDVHAEPLRLALRDGGVPVRATAEGLSTVNLPNAAEMRRLVGDMKKANA